MTPEQQQALDNRPWYRQPIFWILMSGPIIVIIAAFFTFGLAKTTASDMVSDDYYKDGKHINLQLDRDVAAIKRNLHAQVLFNSDYTSAKVFLSGDFDHSQPLKFSLLHPAKKANDQTVELKLANTAASGNRYEYTAAFEKLPATIHWYLRIEDQTGQWRIETKWLPNQGNAVNIDPKQNVLVRGAASASANH